MFVCAGRKNLLVRAKYTDCNSELQASTTLLMDLKKEFPELNRNLYPNIEPYITGMLKVSDLHSIYWEQSGNPDGHVSSHYYLMFFFPQHTITILVHTLDLFIWVRFHVFASLFLFREADRPLMPVAGINVLDVLWK